MRFVRLGTWLVLIGFGIISCDGISEAEKEEMQIEEDLNDNEIPPADEASLDTEPDNTRTETWDSDELPSRDTTAK